MALCVAVVSKENAPKYVTSLNPEDELQIQYEIHSSIDFVEEKLKTGKKDMRDLYLGLLYSTEDHKIYGYVTNTKVKFFVVIDSGNLLLRDNEIRFMFRKLHTAYTDLMCNPFYIPGDYITSENFNKVARGILTGNS
ncbi:trafficking protein particle complex subunit 2-like protein [Rhopalosiphum maidis]|uniref:trafficking protein particle complex subunit 2-like protein n=1 Tax=Rhopalosiphum maidis TaxID=43146 RepID=UPI000EFE1403|nr:trafficking protein particle complex subunit 2-like protein [Rhopalosiphum maidis]XP_060835165.1 trafficking protein particle complex subunit 2-like protein [Rhopalosiphum padi]